MLFPNRMNKRGKLFNKKFCKTVDNISSNDVMKHGYIGEIQFCFGKSGSNLSIETEKARSLTYQVCHFVYLLVVGNEYIPLVVVIMSLIVEGGGSGSFRYRKTEYPGPVIPKSFSVT